MNFEVKEVKKPRKIYTYKPKEEVQICACNDSYIVEKQKP